MKEKYQDKTIFFSVANPIMMRNLLLSSKGVFSILKKKGLKIIVLVPEQAYSRVRSDFEKEGIIVAPLVVNWKRDTLQQFYAFFTTHLVFTEMQRLLARYGTRPDIPAAGGKSFLFPVKAAIAGTFGKWKWFKNTFIAKIDPFVYRKRPHKKIFDEYKPDLVLLPHFHSIQDMSLIREAKRQNVRTLGMLGSWDNFVKRYEPLKVDSLLVWNEPVRKEAIDLQGYKEDIINVTGAPYYDFFVEKDLLLSREDFCKKFNLDPKRKIIFFGSRGKYTPGDPDIISIMLDATKKKHLAGDIQIFVRPYPGMASEHERFDQFETEPLVYNDWIETTKIFGHSGFAWYPTVDEIAHFVNCLYHADIVVNTYSSISIEASVFLKPIININFDGYDKKPYGRSVRRFERLSHFKHVNETRGIVPVNSAKELIDTINKFLQNPNANRENVEALRAKMCYKADGKASERIAGHILDALQ